jgi:hypothetical protein
MNKIRLIFLILVFVITAFCLLHFHKFHAPMDARIEKISDFKITKISGNGKVYLHHGPIEEKDIIGLKPVDIKQMHYPEEMYLKVEPLTSLKFYCFAASFTVLPKSYLHYHIKNKELLFHSGEFYWQYTAAAAPKEKKKKCPVYIRGPRDKIVLSHSGRVRIGENSVEIWNYSGDLEVNVEGEDHRLTANQLLVWAIPGSPNRNQRFSRRRQTSPIQISNILPMPRNIDPAKRSIVLDKPEDSIVRFNWSAVAGNPQYQFRIYSSDLKENVLFEKLLDINRINLDLLQFEERAFYWEVFPLNPEDQREGTPSKMGEINLQGYLLGKKNVQKPPDLNVKPLTVSGNMVFIKGKADPNSQLYINDEEVNIDSEGNFFQTKKFPLGRHKIIIRLVSPLGTVNTVVRYAQIYTDI